MVRIGIKRLLFSNNAYVLSRLVLRPGNEVHPCFDSIWLGWPARDQIMCLPLLSSLPALSLPRFSLFSIIHDQKSIPLSTLFHQESFLNFFANIQCLGTLVAFTVLKREVVICAN